MTVLRASILHCLADPDDGTGVGGWEYFDDGLLMISDGRIIAIGA